MSRLVTEKYPPRGQDATVDAIYARRGSRGITALDAALLNAPELAMGYGVLLETIRTKGRLTGDIREAMILRIAALNGAAYAWKQHVELGRREGLTEGQLYVIRDVGTALVDGGLLAAALRFTDESTKMAGRVSMEVCRGLKKEIGLCFGEGDVDGIYVEAAMVVGGYNMVTRLLGSLDVGGMSDEEVPVI